MDLQSDHVVTRRQYSLGEGNDTELDAYPIDNSGKELRVETQIDRWSLVSVFNHPGTFRFSVHVKVTGMPDTLATLIELQRLKRLERTGWILRGLPNGTESVAAHSFGVAVTAMLLADDLMARGVEIDSEKLLRIALLHDWAEARVGDMPRTATNYFGAEVRRQAEAAAFRDIVQSSSRYLELYDDYEHRGSLEAKLVKAADVIDLLVQVLALERSGARGLDEFWQVAEQPDFQLEGAARESVDSFVASLLRARSEVVGSNR